MKTLQEQINSTFVGLVNEAKARHDDPITLLALDRLLQELERKAEEPKPVVLKLKKQKVAISDKIVSGPPPVIVDDVIKTLELRNLPDRDATGKPLSAFAKKRQSRFLPFKSMNGHIRKMVVAHASCDGHCVNIFKNLATDKASGWLNSQIATACALVADGESWPSALAPRAAGERGLSPVTLSMHRPEIETLRHLSPEQRRTFLQLRFGFMGQMKDVNRSLEYACKVMAAHRANRTDIMNSTLAEAKPLVGAL